MIYRSKKAILISLVFLLFLFSSVRLYGQDTNYWGNQYGTTAELLGGLVVTADCLSAEKRDGTLGLLFLTDLRGVDVVLGKFSALALHALYGMLAVFPALALPLLTGGVTGEEFWRVSLTLLNLLFVSLSIGMLVSAVWRESSHTFTATLLLLLALVIGLPLGVNLLALIPNVPEWIAGLRWLSPGYAYSLGQSPSVPGMGEYWVALATSHGLGWGFLLLAGLVLPRRWQDRERHIKLSS